MSASDTARPTRLAPAISVVICTYNRASLLADLLGGLCSQTLDTAQYEIIVVDNNSTDSTRRVTEGFQGGRVNVRYCLETKQGLSHARNRGWQAARGEYVGYVDDDCRVPEQWLAVAGNVIVRVAPGVLGGPYFAFHSAPKPRWFKDSYGSHGHGDLARALAEAEYLSGGNVFFRRSLLETLGGFDASLGMAGDRIAYGEETALQRRIRGTLPGETIYYEPQLFVYHLIRPDKYSLRWHARQRFASGRDAYRVLGAPSYARNRLLGQALLRVSALGAETLYAALFRDRGQYPYVQNYLLERAFRHILVLGAIYEQRRSAGAGNMPGSAQQDGEA